VEATATFWTIIIDVDYSNLLKMRSQFICRCPQNWSCVKWLSEPIWYSLKIDRSGLASRWTPWMPHCLVAKIGDATTYGPYSATSICLQQRRSTKGSGYELNPKWLLRGKFPH